MKTTTFILALWLSIISMSAQVGINTDSTQPDNSAMLDVKSTDKGMLIPRMTQAQRDAIASPATGLMVYQTDEKKGFYYYTGANWKIFVRKIDDLLDAQKDTINNNMFLGHDGFSGIFYNKGNTGVGIGALMTPNTDNSEIWYGQENTALGYAALNGNRTGQGNTGVGYDALVSTTSGSLNTGVGNRALSGNTTGHRNTAVGYWALGINSVGRKNVAVGFSSLFANEDGSYNIGLGNNSLAGNIHGNYNIGIGFFALGENKNGGYNIVLGLDALRHNESSSNNIVIGNNAMDNDDLWTGYSSQNNLAIGGESLYNHIQGDDNVAIGRKALWHNQSGIKNVAIGNLAGYQNGSDGSVFIGYGAGYGTSGGNVLYIANSPSDYLIRGSFTSHNLEFNGTIKINGGNPGTGKVLTSDTDGNATWETPTAIALGSIDNHTDVDTTTNPPLNGQVLNWDGSNWVPSDVSSASMGSIDLLSDVDTSTNAPTIGQILIWDGTYWVPDDNVTLDGAYDTGGPGAGKNIQADSGAVRIDGDGFLITGTPGGVGSSIDDEATGYGNRMFYNTFKAAFRAGEVATDQWDDVNIGRRSVAIGASPTASGETSVALGNFTIASGYYSTAMGDHTEATVQNTTALGFYAEAKGFYSTSIGDHTYAWGKHSLAMGSYTSALSFMETAFGAYNQSLSGDANSWNSSNMLFSIGNGTSTSNRHNALTIYKDGRVNINDEYFMPQTDGTAGQFLKTNGFGHVNFVDLPIDGLDDAYDKGGSGAGKNITADNGAVRVGGTDGLLVTGTYGAGFPIDSEITGAGTRMFFNPKKSAFRAGTVGGNEWDDANIGAYSSAMGSSTTALGQSSTAMGSNTTASGDASIAMGFGTTSFGDYSTAMGANTTASASMSAAMGGYTTASGYASIAMGYLTTASGEESFSMGLNDLASGDVATAFGYHTSAKSSREMTIGSYNTDYTPVNTTGWDSNDRLFTIGNGVDVNNKHNALTIYKDGRMNINDAYTMPLTDGSNGQIMKTDGSGQISWVNPPSQGAVIIDDLSDVDISTTSPTNGQILSWDGTNWVPADDANTTYTAGTGLDLSATVFSLNSSIDNLTDVDVTTIAPTNGQILSWDGTNWVPADDGVGAREINDLSDGINDDSSVFLGTNSGINDDSSSNLNVGLGTSALTSNTTGSENVAIGAEAFYNNISGNQNTIIGRGSGLHTTGSGNVFIGYRAGNSETGSNKLYIANSATTSPLIYGDFSTSKVEINGTVMITGGSPGSGKVLTSDAVGNATWKTPTGGGAQEINDLTDGKTAGTNSVFLGGGAGYNNGSTDGNTGTGNSALATNSSGTNNSAFGAGSIATIGSGNDNTALGYLAGAFDASGNPLTNLTSGIYIGSNTKASVDGNTGEIVIGTDMTGMGSNSVILGNPASNLKTILTGKVGVMTPDPKSALQVNGGVQVADDSDAASTDKVGTLRYRSDANNSYVEMCVQTGVTTYSWVVIHHETW